jgi:AcrR family transcriptional regulator
MPSGDLDRMPEERRRRLVRTAATEFAQAGYEAASLNRIIQACGLSKSSFYHFIESKEALFDLVVADLSAALVSELDVPTAEQLQAGEFWPMVSALFDRVLASLEADESYAALGRIYYLSGAPHGAGGAVSRSLASVESWVRGMLEIGRNSGAVRTDLPVELQAQLVFAVLRALDEWSVRHLDSIPAEQWTGILLAQKAAIRRLLEADASANPDAPEGKQHR